MTVHVPLAAPPGQYFKVSQAVRESLFKAARSAGDEECCGVLLGIERAGAITVARAIPLANEAAERTRNFAFSAEALHAVSGRFRDKWDILGFYHSHPNGRRGPSGRDLEFASAWPGYLHAIIVAAPGRPPEVSFYRVGASSWDELGAGE